MDRILILVDQCPADPSVDKGAGGSLYWMIKHAKNLEIDLLYVGSRNFLREKCIANYIKNIFFIPIQERNKFDSFFCGIIKRYPRKAAIYDSKVLFSKIESTVDLNSYQGIVVVDYFMLDILKYLQKYNPVFFAIDSLSLNYRKKTKFEKYWTKRVFDFLQYLLSLSAEKNVIIPMARKVVFVSEVDRDYEREKVPSKKEKITFIRHGVEIPSNYNSEMYNKQEFNVVLTGNMTYLPNKDAAIYFAKEVFPSVKKYISDIHFYIVGNYDDIEISDLQCDNITVTGYVDNIYSYIASADVCVSPLRYGTGIKNKILEAMACGRAIVASSPSIDGIEFVKEGVNYLIADTVNEWCDKLYKLYLNKSDREAMGEKNLCLVKDCFSWENTFEELIK